MSRDSRRPKGYIDWTPAPHVAVILQQAKAVLAENSAYGPMTGRQIFYGLVAGYGYEKTELAYKRLLEYLVKARRAQLIGFHAIRDGGGVTAGGAYGDESVEAFLETLADYSTRFTMDPTLGQPNVIELWCEEEGMVPMLAQMTRAWGVTVTGTGGFSSVTVTNEFAKRVMAREVPTVLLHVGDHDPSGLSIFESMCQDIGAFIAAETGNDWDPETGWVDELLTPQRVTVTAEQVAEHGFTTAPPKSSDSRSASWVGRTTQTSAVPLPLLEQFVQDAVREHVDQDLYDQRARETREGRELIGGKVEDAINEIREELS